MQVGQTGTVVSPKLYVACGISGQIQHKIGIEKSGLIVAVNTDKEAPIMSFCDLGIVGDLRVVLPALAAEIRAARQA
jgi:electron transfer flavoprotein alpha subunit